MPKLPDRYPETVMDTVLKPAGSNLLPVEYNRRMQMIKSKMRCEQHGYHEQGLLAKQKMVDQRQCLRQVTIHAKRVLIISDAKGASSG